MEVDTEDSLLLYRVFAIYNKLTFLMIGLYSKSLKIKIGKFLYSLAPAPLAFII